MASWSRIARHIRVPLGFLFAALYLWLAKPQPAFMIAGAVLIVAGLLLRGLASGHVRKNERLATSGPYAYTRNPLYLGSLTLAAGFALAARSWWIAGALIVFFIAIYLPVIGGEEDFLRQRFPEFEDYAQHVRSLWPRLTPYRQGPSATFCWKLYLKHREYNALLGAAVILAALTAKLIWMRR
jgi:protein-S-isoprenylcysteine O-methyltransferase Ste14